MSNHSQEDAFAGPPAARGRRYFFDVRDGEHLQTDEEGVHCASLDEAANEAVATLQQMGREMAPESDRRDLVVTVRDETGREVLRASLLLRVERLA